MAIQLVSNLISIIDDSGVYPWDPENNLKMLKNKRSLMFQEPDKNESSSNIQ